MPCLASYSLCKMVQRICLSTFSPILNFDERGGVLFPFPPPHHAIYIYKKHLTNLSFDHLTHYSPYRFYPNPSSPSKRPVDTQYPPCMPAL